METINSKQSNNYYNAKPSLISNIGADVAGAKRHNFDTYETTEEKAKRKQSNKDLKQIKETLKNEVLSDSPNFQIIADLTIKQFKLEFGFDYNNNTLIEDKRHEMRSTAKGLTYKEQAPLFKEFNRIVSASNKVCNTVRNCERFSPYLLRKLKNKYSPKKSAFREENGKTFDWSNFINSTSITEDLDLDYLKENTKAVQFGNSVSDKERGYISLELTNFLKAWNFTSLKNIAWSFGARGKPGSVAYYQHLGQIISVNRHNIGSVLHEVGHHLDAIKGTPSNQISYETIQAYRATLGNLDRLSMNYYCKREEIFARAFEVYFLGKFSSFVQSGNNHLPELNEELIKLVESVL